MGRPENCVRFIQRDGYLRGRVTHRSRRRFCRILVSSPIADRHHSRVLTDFVFEGINKVTVW